MPITVSATRVRDRRTVEPSADVPGWLRTTANTGLAAVGIDRSTLPTWSGSLTVNGGTIDGYKIDMGSGQLELQNGATVKNCWIIGGNYNIVYITGNNCTLLNCDIDGNASTATDSGVYLLGSTTGALIKNIAIRNMLYGLYGEGAGTVEDYYAYDFASVADKPGGHRDGFTRRGNSALLTVRRSRFDVDRNGTTGACFFQDTYGSTNNGYVEFDQCSFEGAGICITLENAKQVGFTDCRIRPYGTYSLGAVSRDDNAHPERGATTTTSWSVWLWDSGAADYKGSAVSDPAP